MKATMDPSQCQGKRRDNTVKYLKTPTSGTSRGVESRSPRWCIGRLAYCENTDHANRHFMLSLTETYSTVRKMQLSGQ